MFRSSTQVEQIGEGATIKRPFWLRVLPALLVLLALLNGLFFALALKPAGERAREERRRLEKLRSDSEARRTAVARLNDVVSQLDMARNQGGAFYQEKFLPRNDGFSTIMEELDKLARANKVYKSAVSYGFGEVQGRPDLNQVTITTGIEGDYTHVVGFINELERDQLFLVIDQISVAAGGQTPGQGQPQPKSNTIRLAIRLATFFRVGDEGQLRSDK